MERKVIFKDTVTGEELMLPVTPPEIAAASIVNVEITNISAVGDVALPGKPGLSSPQLDCLFPTQRYSFCACAPLDPYAYVDKFKAWAADGRVLRYIWSGTTVNIPVLVESINYKEDDGTNDVRAVLNLREYRYIKAELTPLGETLSSRSEEPAAVAEQSYTVVSGDTLSAIARTYYGDAALYSPLAKYNGIKNPDLIHPGQLIKLPPVDVLRGLVPSYGKAPRAKIPKKAKARYSDRVLAMKERQMSRL